METSVSLQAAAMGLAALIGAGLGLAYDLLRPLRRRAGRAAAILLDLLFSVGSGVAAFLYAMGAGEGRLGVCQLGAMTAGFLLYIYIAGDTVCKKLDKRTLACRGPAVAAPRQARYRLFTAPWFGPGISGGFCS